MVESMTETKSMIKTFKASPLRNWSLQIFLICSNYGIRLLSLNFSNANAFVAILFEQGWGYFYEIVGSVAEKVKASLLRRAWIHTLDMTIYDDYLDFVTSNKQQIYMERSQTSFEKLENGRPLSGWGQFVLNKNVTVVFSRVEDKYGLIKSKSISAYKFFASNF